MDQARIADYIGDWLKRRLEESGLDGFVVGVSGGIDSAVTSALCARTRLPLVAAMLPLHSREGDCQLAREHLAWLTEHHPQVKTKTIDLTAAFDLLRDALPKSCRDDRTLANARSRLRMTALYALASGNRALVCGTGNRVEDFGIGFFTKYGDGGVDISPIADLNKSEVYRLAAHLGVCEGIQNAAPVDGLWPDARTDEEQIGASYAELEWAMDYDGDPQQLQGRQREVYDTYQRLHQQSKHKINPIPVCVIPSELLENEKKAAAG